MSEKSIVLFACLLFVFSAILIPVHAHAEEATAYAFICPNCDEKLIHQTYQYDVTRNVANCTEAIKSQTHTDRVFESVYLCVNNDCSSIGYETNRRTSVLYTTCNAG